MHISYLWNIVPLVFIVSLVYGATRHELMIPILGHAFRFGVWVAGFIFVLFLILLGVSWLV